MAWRGYSHRCADDCSASRGRRRISAIQDVEANQRSMGDTVEWMTGARSANIARAVALPLVLTLFLAGCTANDSELTGKGQHQNTPRPTPTSGASAIPVPPTVQQPYDAVTQIIVRPEMLELKDLNGTDVATISYDAPADEFVAAFTALLGSAPTITEYPGGLESQASTYFTWDGFELTDDHEVGDYQVDMNVAVKFSAAELGPRAITVSTIQGFKPGDDLRWLARYMDEPFYENNDHQEIQAEHGPPIGEPEVQGYSNSNSVTGRTGFPGKESVIYAPWNFGIGHV